MNIKIPEQALVVLIGPSGSGKSTFARKFFKPTEIVSSDTCRGLVSDDENNQAATQDAFDLVHYIVRKRLKNGLLTVVDATNVQPAARKVLIEIAREYHCLAVALVLDLPAALCHARNQDRPDRDFGSHVVRHQRSQLRRGFRGLKKEGFRNLVVMRSPEEVDAVEAIVRTPLYNNKKEETGPFDIIGDIHGCYTELTELLRELDYAVEEGVEGAGRYGIRVTPPEGRKAVFLGDLVDRGPNSPGVLKLVMTMVEEGSALCVVGNHDWKLLRKLRGKNVNLNHGLAETMEQLEAEPEAFHEEVREFLDGLISHYVLDDGRLVVAHAGLREEMHGRASGRVRSFCMYGETTGEIDQFGLPVRYNWAMEYRGRTRVVYGHTPVPAAQWLNRTIDIDTGCVFGGKLTALRYPEMEIISVPAHEVYEEPAKPLDWSETGENPDWQLEADGLLDIEDVTGKRYITTRLWHNLSIREENSVAALEVMSRFAVNPKWLIYLPPTMSPCETSELDGYLEHPSEALNYFADREVNRVVFEEKHMGSRAVIVLAKDTETVARRFGLEGDRIGVCYTRTGRNFFNDAEVERAFLNRLRDDLSQANFWEEFRTDWVCLDCELMPWSAKAQGLLRNQYAAVGASSRESLSQAEQVLTAFQHREIEGAAEMLANITERKTMAAHYVDAYRHYCWDVNNLDDYKLAPFHILATEGAVHTDKNHQWHMDAIHKLCAVDPGFLTATPYRVVDLDDARAVDDAIAWWTELTEKGGEGMVIKPFDFVSNGKRGLIQPAIKCRGQEYLRIIYGPEYTAPKYLRRLRHRNVKGKRSLALREFVLGVESLERFVNKEPLRRVHECVFGVLALESEPVDPRL